MELEGVVDDFSNGKFKVKVSDTHFVMCTLSGKIRTNQVKILLGDKVKVEVSPYDTTQGRIVYRLRAPAATAV